MIFSLLMIPTPTTIAFLMLLALSILVMVKGGIRIPLPDVIGSPVLDVTGLMQVVVSIVALAAGLYVILSHSYSADEKKWGYGTVGTIVGYWLRPAPLGPPGKP
jgi:hypothetical protein